MRNSRRIALIAASLGAALGLHGALLAPGGAAPSARGRARPIVERPAPAVTAHASAPQGVRRASDPVAAPPRREDAPIPGVTAAASPRPGAERRPEPPDERPSRSRAARMATSPLLRVDPPDSWPGAVTESISGFDPGAPRRLTLWRVEEGRSSRLAVTQSDPAGRFRFPDVASGRRELVVSADGDAPEASAARVRLPPLEVEAPAVQAFAGEDASARLRLWPSALAVTVLAASGGQEILRRPVPALPDARDRAFDVPLLLPSRDVTVWIAEERADGSRSPWTPVRFERPAEDLAGPPETPRRE